MVSGGTAVRIGATPFVPNETWDNGRATAFRFPGQTDFELVRIAAKLETHYRDMQDVEFTVQEGKLFMLQTRAGKRSMT